MSKKRGPQVICRSCSAYKFPHRLGGGKCDGSEWAESYRANDGDMCFRCNCNRSEGPNGCDVINGAEDIREGDCYQEHLRRELGPEHPTTLDEIFGRYR